MVITRWIVENTQIGKTKHQDDFSCTLGYHEILMTLTCKNNEWKMISNILMHKTKNINAHKNEKHANRM